MKIETQPAPNPLQTCDAKIKQATQNAHDEQARLQRVYSNVSRATFEPGADVGPAQYAVLQRQHADRGTVARHELRNYDPQRAANAMLDGHMENKSLLQNALDHVRKLHVAQTTTPASTVAPKKKGLIGLIESKLGDPVVDETPTFPPSRPLPRGGLFGQDEPMNVDAELLRLQTAIKAFPWDLSFSDVVAALNKIAATLVKQEPPKPPPVRMDKGFIPKHG